MIVDLKPYPEYKASGLPWLGAIPASWTVKRAKSVFERLDKRSKTGREQLLTVSSARGIVPRNTANVTMFKAESYVGYKLCWPDDLVINSLWAWAGGLGVSKHHGIISSAYGVYRLRQDAPLIPAFVHEVVRSLPFNWELRVRSKGVWISRLQMTDLAFLDAPVFIPPSEEQEAIVRFLDWANGRLERAIRAKRKVIDLLNEQKQAIIHRAVTRGLDPTVPLKPSGVPWLGEIPEHWSALTFARIIKHGPQNGISPAISDVNTIESFSISAIRNGTVDIREVDRKYVSGRPELLKGKYGLSTGDILIVRGNGNIRLVGRAGLVESDLGDRVYPDLLMRVRVTDRALPAYVVMLLNGPTVRNQVESFARTAVGTFKVNNQQVRQLCISLPSRSEQNAIVEFIEQEIRPIEVASARVTREIDLLREYRTRLIADVVTGKLDVREAAARLPDTAQTDISEVDEGILTQQRLMRRSSLEHRHQREGSGDPHHPAHDRHRCP